MKQQLEQNSTSDTLTIRVWDHNRLLVPSVGTITISRDGTALVSGASATIATDGTCTYVPGVTVTATLDEDLKIAWLLTISGDKRTHVQLCDVVKYVLLSELTDEDLISECAQLQDEKYRASGLADSGTLTTIVAGALREYREDHFKGGSVEIVAGTNLGEVRTISGSDRDTGTLTVATFSGTIDTTSFYVAKRTFQREIDRAWEDILSMITAQAEGRRPALIMSREILITPHLMLTLEKVCRDLSATPEDIWWEKADYYRKQFGERWDNLRFRYDSDQDGEIDSTVTTRPVLLR